MAATKKIEAGCYAVVRGHCPLKLLKVVRPIKIDCRSIIWECSHYGSYCEYFARKLKRISPEEFARLETTAEYEDFMGGWAD